MLHCGQAAAMTAHHPPSCGTPMYAQHFCNQGSAPVHLPTLSRWLSHAHPEPRLLEGTGMRYFCMGANRPSISTPRSPDLLATHRFNFSPRPLYGFSCLSSWLCRFVHVCVCGTRDGITAFLEGGTMRARDYACQGPCARDSQGLCVPSVPCFGLELSLVTQV
jgi:hypothetical protein